MALLDYSHKKAITFGAVILVLFVFFPTLFSVLFPAADEVSYSAGVASSTCSAFFVEAGADGSSCSTRYSVVVGNTGSNLQEVVTVELRPLLPGQPVGWNIVDIVASAVRTPPPTITDEVLEDGRRLVIEGLAPNRQVVFILPGRGMQSVEQMANISATVVARGRVIASNPSLTVMSRFVKNVFGIFGV